MIRDSRKIADWDWVVILTISALLLMGVINIYSAAYNPDRPFLFDFNTLYGKQIIWIGIGVLLGFIISLIDARHIQLLTPAFYIFVLFLLIIVLFTESINGARSWLGVGSFGIQPSEFSKLSTALMLALVISNTQRGRETPVKSLLLSLLAILTTMFLVLIQNDTGTFLVFTAFFFVLYREGITFDPIILFILNNIFGLRLKSTLVGIHFIPVSFVIILFSIIILIYTDSIHTFSFIPGYDVPGWALLIVGVTLLLVIFYLFTITFITQRGKRKLRNLFFILYILAVSFIGIVSYTYINVLQSHQVDRINLWLGKIEDQDGKDYNRNRALAAVGSGGFSGVGYQEAILSSPRSKHVPESETDFIFSVYSEEWGFLGTFLMVSLFLTLFIRIIIIAERQKDRFARAYAYGVLMILFYHFFINIGMNIGLVPVIGIPLPFFSYGGSSMMSFLIMIFILLKLDSQRKEILS